MRILLTVTILAGSSMFGQSASQESSAKKEAAIPMTSSLDGSEMYKTWCASCHGISGKGDGPAASALKTRPADLTQLAKKNGGKFPTEKVRSYIDGTAAVDAHGSREMPVWGTFLLRLGSDKGEITYRIVTLANYVLSLQTK